MNHAHLTSAALLQQNKHTNPYINKRAKPLTESLTGLDQKSLEENSEIVVLSPEVEIRKSGVNPNKLGDLSHKVKRNAPGTSLNT